MQYHVPKLLLMANCLLVALLSYSCGNDENDKYPETTKQVEKSVVTGVIEKGPFVQGSKVILYELTADLLQTGKSFKTQTSSDLGDFRFDTPISLQSQFVELETSGYFYNEVLGGLSASQITLNALSNIENRNSINVNLITHLEFNRVKKLVSEGKTFAESKKQTERELLACFAIKDEIASPEAISITDNNKNSAILLAISTVMLYEKSEAEFSELIAKFSSDFADNGKIDNSFIKDIITEGEKNAHPKDIIARMKEFYANKGITMECDDFSDYIDFNGDGVIDENDKEDDNYTSLEFESFWNTRADVIGVLNTCYYHYMQFESNQMKLEEIRTDKEKVHTINPQSSVLSDTYTSAYTVINTANLLLEHAPSVKQADASMSSEELDAILAETRSLRAFAYYNLAMLWGNVVLVDKPTMVDGFDYPAQSMQSEVYKFAYSDICYAIDKLPGTYNTEIETKERFTRNAALMLKAEIELAMGNSSEARSTIGKISDTVNFCFSNMEQNIIPIYTAKHLSLYEKEANRNTNGLEKEWASMPNGTYGFWSAIKRLGKAQEMTGCYDYELLMPFPLQDIIMDPKLRQNSGY